MQPTVDAFVIPTPAPAGLFITPSLGAMAPEAELRSGAQVLVVHGSMTSIL